jgi:cytochrome c oxidase cbb3-type subunit III
VTTDLDGDKIGEVVRNGRAAGMPKFKLSDGELKELVAFLHTQAGSANSEEAERRRITVKDLLTGNVEAGKQFFGAHCAECHSATGDLAGVVHRYEPMKLEAVMLYPGKAARTATITSRSGEAVSGRLVHLDEFAVSIQDAKGWQHSWPRDTVTVEVKDPAAAHLKLLPQYSDADVHNIFAYLQTLQ